MNYYDDLFWKMALKDDEAAFQTLFYQFFTPLCAYAMRFIPNREDCEDIVQDTFLKLWESRKKLEINYSFRSFLISAVKNACIDHLRRQETESLWKERFTENRTVESPEDLHAVSELEQMLNAALDKMPDKMRTSLEMNRLEGKTYAEIAELQHLSVKTVESHISKALKLLRVELKDFLTALIFFLYNYF
ncbi:MAG: RNA polymerase sigma-70 factor [Tannerella sp.]|jgi:RNA polymerase sigma-70 factor (ECF subfamily)|nr:RNA polymerase sigma-70 factor [Tannerella sp.]